MATVDSDKVVCGGIHAMIVAVLVFLVYDNLFGINTNTDTIDLCEEDKQIHYSLKQNSTGIESLSSQNVCLCICDRNTVYLLHVCLFLPDANSLFGDLQM
jgi:hypothetical protein